MEELKELYESKKYAALDRACRKAEAGDSQDFEVYLYHACGLAARSNFSHFTMEQAIDLFRKAGKCSKGNPEQQQLLYHLFTVEVIKAVQRYEDTFSSVSMTNEIVESYRNSMRLAADALQEAVVVGEQLTQLPLDGESSVLSAKKLAVHCMVELCKVRKYEVDMGKAISKRTNNAPEEIRSRYAILYDNLTEQIQAVDTEYEPELIQRDFVKPDETNACQLKMPSAEPGVTGGTGETVVQTETEKTTEQTEPGEHSRGLFEWMKGKFR